MVDFLSKEGVTPRPRLGGLAIKDTEEALDIKFKSWKHALEEFTRVIYSS